MASMPETSDAVGAVRVGAFAAVAGGLCWVLKAAAILATGDQPPAAFEVGPPLFAVALLGFYGTVSPADTRAKTGAWAAGVGLALMVVGAVARAIDPDLAPEGEQFTPLSALMVVTTVCLLAALVLLGLAARRVGRPASTAMPLWMGVLLVPGLIVGGALSAVDERLLEAPVLIFGLAWITLGYKMWRAADRTPRSREEQTVAIHG